MAKRAGARITDVHAGHLSLISEPPAVTRVITRFADWLSRSAAR